MANNTVEKYSQGYGLIELVFYLSILCVAIFACSHGYEYFYRSCMKNQRLIKQVMHSLTIFTLLAHDIYMASSDPECWVITEKECIIKQEINNAYHSWIKWSAGDSALIRTRGTYDIFSGRWQSAPGGAEHILWHYGFFVLRPKMTSDKKEIKGVRVILMSDNPVLNSSLKSFFISLRNQKFSYEV